MFGEDENLSTTRVRLRTIDRRSVAEELLITPDELAHRAVLVKADVFPVNSLLEALATSTPWLIIWREHRAWKTGVWRCEINGEDEFRGHQPNHVPFHTDMSRYLHPPQFTAIRCVKNDTGMKGAGANLIIHINDVLKRLEQLSRFDLLDVLYRPRRLNVSNKEQPLISIVPNSVQDGVVRIFDQKAATKGEHFELSNEERVLLDELVILCDSWKDLILSVSLRPGDWIIFSNHRFLHARSVCSGLGRVTEVCLGNRKA